eukprot:scaffold170357_cov30-Tisochrysis_lutea.AAC.2
MNALASPLDAVRSWYFCMLAACALDCTCVRGGKGDEAGGGVGLVAAVLEVFRVVGEVVVVGGRGWWFGVRGHPAVEVVAGGRESIVLFLRL